MGEGHLGKFFPQYLPRLNRTQAALLLADDIIGEELDELNRHSDDCYTPSDFGRVFGLDARDLNSFLSNRGIIRWGHGQWELTRIFQNQGLAEKRNFIYHGRDGHRRTQSRLVWTRKGRDFLMELIKIIS